MPAPKAAPSQTPLPPAPKAIPSQLAVRPMPAPKAAPSQTPQPPTPVPKVVPSQAPPPAPEAIPSQTTLPPKRRPKNASPASARQYKIVGSDGRTYGPAGATLVREWISQGFANAQTWVPSEGPGNWKQLREFPEFAEALVGVTTPTNLLGTPPKDALWEEPIKVAPSAGPEPMVALEQEPVAELDRPEATRTRVPIFVGVLMLLVVAGAVAAWLFDRWPFSPRGPLRRYARMGEGYIYVDPDYEAAAKAEDAKDYKAVLKNAKQLVSRYPNSSLVYCVLGVAYGKLGSYSDATVAFHHAIKLQPDYINAWNNLGWAYWQMGRYAEAVKAFQQLIKLTPNDPQIWSNLGGAQAGQGHQADAIAAYQMAIQLDPTYADAHFNLGVAYANQGKLADAVNSLRQAVTYKPDYPEAWFNLGIISSRQGEDNGAVVFLQKAVYLRPNYADAWRGLVKSYLALHETDKADKAARELKRLDPAKADQLAKELGREAPQPQAR
jgi:tetratricopeptide (TPR) repeat protein